MRYRLDIAYRGTKYHGWQIQPNAISVQGTLNQKISMLLRTEVKTTGSGRTDTGVHAEKQVVHFDCNQIIKEDLVYKLNKVLPHDISALNLTKVTENFHARFSAKSRAYIYRINTYKDPFLQDQSYLYTKPLDFDTLQAGCQLLKNNSNFESFSKIKTSVNNFECEIFKIEWKKSGENITFNIQANRFLRNMVRAIVGTMLDLGTHQITLQEFEEIIKSKSRKKAGYSVPAHGLYLTEVNYE